MGLAEGEQWGEKLRKRTVSEEKGREGQKFFLGKKKQKKLNTNLRMSKHLARKICFAPLLVAFPKKKRKGLRW